MNKTPWTQILQFAGVFIAGCGAVFAVQRDWTETTSKSAMNVLQVEQLIKFKDEYERDKKDDKTAERMISIETRLKSIDENITELKEQSKNTQSNINEIFRQLSANGPAPGRIK